MIQVEGCFENIMFDVVTGSSKPVVVEQDQIFAITSTVPDEIYVSAAEPTSPSSGDIWVMLGDSVCRLNLSDTFDVGLSAVRQYDGSGWMYLAAYVGRENGWELFGVPVFARDVVDTPQSLDEIGYDDRTGWDYIILLCNSGVDVRDYFLIGDMIDLTLTYKDNSSEVATMAVGTFYRNNISGTNKKASIGFTQINLLTTTTIATGTDGNLLLSNLYNMEKTDTNINSWSGSMMCTEYVPIIFEALPNKLRNSDAIKTVDVYTSSGNKSTALIISCEKVRIHSGVELGVAYCSSSTLYAVLSEGSTYEYYAVASNRIKRLSGTVASYWTRSPDIGGATNFMSISTTGTIGTRQAQPNTRAAIALTFDI